MHTTNGFLEHSGQEDGAYRISPPRDQNPSAPSHQPGYSEFGSLSLTVREKLYRIQSQTQYAKHYIRKSHKCSKCSQSFTSKAGLREHCFDCHSY